MKDFNVIEEAKKQLEWNLSYYSKEFANDLLKYGRQLTNTHEHQLIINRFLLNLLTAYDTNITPYLPKEKELEE